MTAGKHWYDVVTKPHIYGYPVPTPHAKVLEVHELNADLKSVLIRR